MTTFIRFKDELEKLGFEYQVTKEFEDRFHGVIIERGMIVLNKWIFWKCLLPSKVNDFVKTTTSAVNYNKKMLKIGTNCKFIIDK